MFELVLNSYDTQFGLFILLIDSFFYSMIGLDPSTTNYPGKIPSGLDLPSDVVDDKAEERRI